MALYAVSDIHGEYNALMDVLEKAAFGKSDKLYILGDLLDRGPRCRQLIEWIVSTELDVEYILGNHEDMLMRSLVGDWRNLQLEPQVSPSWFMNGGRETYKALRKLSPDTLAAFQEKVKSAPMFAAPDNADGEMVLLVHAGVAAPEDPDDIDGWLMQSPDSLMWDKNWYKEEAIPPFEVVSGHIPVYIIATQFEGPIPASQRLSGRVGEMMHWRRKHAIDCGAGYAGSVGLLRLDDWAEFYAKVR